VLAAGVVAACVAAGSVASATEPARVPYGSLSQRGIETETAPALWWTSSPPALRWLFDCGDGSGCRAGPVRDGLNQGG
jgi:hypothetical protein